MNIRLLVVGGTTLALVAAFLLAAERYRNQKAEEMSFLAQENARLFVPEDAPTMGNEKASVFIVEFLDPECEACRAFYPSVKKIMKDYEKDLQLVVRYAPFHKNSMNAVRVLEASRKQNKYWETMEILFATQPQWAAHHNPQPERIWEIVPKVGINVEQAKADMMDPEISARIQQDIKDGEILGVRRTPTFFVNGTPLQRFSYDDLVALVESEIEKAKGLQKH